MSHARHNGSSIEGGIFGNVSAPPAPLPSNHCTYSSQEGGIFGEAPKPASTPRGAITGSSIQGGVFGGVTYDSENPAFKRRSDIKGQKLDPAAMQIAGNKTMVTSLNNGVEWTSNPVEPLQVSARDHNASSINGGIFGGEAAQCAADYKPLSSRRNFNASSIPGGIFG